MEPDPKARALIRAARASLRATDADRARIEAALRARLGSEALPAESGVTQHASSAVSWPLTAAVAIGVSLLGAVAFLALRPAASSSAPRGRDREALPQLQAPSTAPGASPPSAASMPGPGNSEAHEPRAPDQLAREVALLSRATAELRAGHTAAALKVLAEHQRKFPDGALSEERRGAKAQALCLSGHVSEGRAELTQLAPQSPAVARARQACDVRRRTQ